MITKFHDMSPSRFSEDDSEMELKHNYANQKDFVSDKQLLLKHSFL